MRAPLPYMHVLPADPWSVDRGHLKTLAICHYVAGGLELVFSSFFILYIVIGLVFVNDPNAFAPPAGSRAGAQPQPPPEFGWMFVGMGSCIVLLGWTTGILTIVSGRGIARLRRRTFSLVMAGVNCLWMPIGTVLGVFTFIVLMRGSVIALYEQQKWQEAAGQQPAGGHAAG